MPDWSWIAISLSAALIALVVAFPSRRKQHTGARVCVTCGQPFVPDQAALALHDLGNFDNSKLSISCVLDICPACTAFRDDGPI